MTTLTAPFTYEGVTYHLEYDPAVLASAETKALISEMQRATDQDEQHEIHLELLCNVLVGWDIHGLDGELLPISAHTFTRVLPMLFDAFAVKALLDHAHRRGRQGRRR